MNKRELKRKMLEESITKHQAVINDFDKRIFDLKRETKGWILKPIRWQEGHSTTR